VEERLLLMASMLVQEALLLLSLLLDLAPELVPPESLLIVVLFPALDPAEDMEVGVEQSSPSRFSVVRF
jgi:hypothetical protein